MRKRTKDAGWYHYSDMDGFHGVEFLPFGLLHVITYGDFSYRQSAYGPFKTFGEAKMDALEFFRADVDQARERIRNVKSFKKYMKIYEKTGEEK